MDRLQDRFATDRLWIWAVVIAVLLGATLFGATASLRWLALLVAASGIFILLQRPLWGLLLLVIVALVGPLEFGTGTDVAVNLATLLVPALLGVWILGMMHRHQVRLVASRTNKPLIAFLLAGLLSLLVGRVLWDPAVPRSSNFLVVQLAQWAIFAFSAGAFWLVGNLVHSETWLRRLTFLFLALAGGLAIFRVLPGIANWTGHVATAALSRAPFWMTLSALATGQLLFNQKLSRRWKSFLLITLLAVMVFALLWQRQTASYWVGIGAVLGTLVWLRFPRLRWIALLAILVLTASGFLSSAIYDFAGGQAEWEESGGSRIVLIYRVLKVTMRNPVTGLGPAAYRPYAGVEPLPYGNAYWVAPLINSHNNYVDLFSHVGLLGLGLFFWFVVELARLGISLRTRFAEGFAAGYVNGMLAAGVGALILMVFADWILPFVYNIGFPGFQASVLTWLFFGGLVSLEHMARGEQKV